MGLHAKPKGRAMGGLAGVAGGMKGVGLVGDWARFFYFFWAGPFFPTAWCVALPSIQRALSLYLRCRQRYQRYAGRQYKLQSSSRKI